MTGHDTIKQLREMEQDVEPVPWIFDLDGVYVHDPYTGDIIDIPNGGDDAEFIAKMRNNTDLLLSIAEAFQPGDAELMKWALDETEDTGSPIRKMLHRLQAAAERLEG